MEPRLRALCDLSVPAVREEAGRHEYDGVVPDLSPSGIARSLAALGGGMTSPRLANPLSAQESLLRPTLLPGLLAAVSRNASRGLADVAVFETGHVFLGEGGYAPAPGVDGPKAN